MSENQNYELDSIKEEYKSLQMTKEQVSIMKKKMEEAKLELKKRNNKKVIYRCVAGVATVAAAFIVVINVSPKAAYAMQNVPVLGSIVKVVTVRDYQYQDDQTNVDIKVPELVVGDVSQQGNINEEQLEEINAEIQSITDQIILEVEESLEKESGNHDWVVNHEVIETTEDYFTLKVNCYEGAASGAEWNYFYTIDLVTGERLKLMNLFEEGADYITVISENIKTQMREQMNADENVSYWLDETEVEEWNFDQITDETSFYINEAGNVVISFNEGDVAPMYMGVVEFTIPNDVVAEIRK